MQESKANCHICQMLNYFNYVPSTAMARIKTANITLRSKAFEIGDIVNFQQKQKKSQLLTLRAGYKGVSVPCLEYGLWIQQQLHVLDLNAFKTKCLNLRWVPLTRACVCLARSHEPFEAGKNPPKVPQKHKNTHTLNAFFPTLSLFPCVVRIHIHIYPAMRFCSYSKSR